jgi:hypothetical protein
MSFASNQISKTCTLLHLNSMQMKMDRLELQTIFCSKVSCLHMHFLGDTICLLTNQKIIKIVALIDLHIVLIYEC